MIFFVNLQISSEIYSFLHVFILLLSTLRRHVIEQFSEKVGFSMTPQLPDIDNCLVLLEEGTISCLAQCLRLGSSSMLSIEQGFVATTSSIHIRSYQVFLGNPL